MYCGARQWGDEIIDWNQSSRDIFNFIRALNSPELGASSWINGKKIIIYKSKMVEGSHVYKNIVGQVVGKNRHGFIVKTADTVIEVIDYSYDGKIRIGDRLINYAQENKG
jgi:methionyl-tRNA formyltransferase